MTYAAYVSTYLLEFSHVIKLFFVFTILKIQVVVIYSSIQFKKQLNTITVRN